MLASKPKYGNKKTTLDGITFDSKKESRRYAELKLLLKAGEISGLELQKKLLIIPKTATERAAYYVADFFYMQGGRQIIEDTKSEITRKNPVYILKRKLVKQLYPSYVFIEGD
jgi:hypothetical protein